MFPVQKNIPMPGVDRSPRGVERKYKLHDMAVGDMFFVPGRTSKSVSAYIVRISKDMSAKFSVRHCWMKQIGETEWVLVDPAVEGAVEGVGVWRTE